MFARWGIVVGYSEISILSLYYPLAIWTIYDICLFEEYIYLDDKKWFHSSWFKVPFSLTQVFRGSAFFPPFDPHHTQMSLLTRQKLRDAFLLYSPINTQCEASQKVNISIFPKYWFISLAFHMQWYRNLTQH